MDAISETGNTVVQGSDWPHRHLLSISDLAADDVTRILDLAETHAATIENRSAPGGGFAGLTLANLFFENSTRTLMSFEMAAKRLGMHVLSLPIAASSRAKGEGDLDTARTLAAMGIDVMAIRHQKGGTPAMMAEALDCAILNAGDGARGHPTQALADAMVIRRRKDGLKGLTVAICGDIRHSRVASSNRALLEMMGARVRFVGPAPFLPDVKNAGRAELTSDFDAAIADADVIMMLRIQVERMEKADIPSHDVYFADYGLTRERLDTAKPDAVVMHPGPMNRYVEIAPEVADDPARSAILDQVSAGVAVRMACLDLFTRHRRG